MKNLTTLGNIRQIMSNHVNCGMDGSNRQYLNPDRTHQLLNQVNLDCTLNSIRLYGLTFEQSGLVKSDFGDFTLPIITEIKSFQTLEVIYNFLLDKLHSNHEVYVHSIGKAEIMDFERLSPKIVYQLTFRCINRHIWREMANQAENPTHTHVITDVIEEEIELRPRLIKPKKHRFN